MAVSALVYIQGGDQSVQIGQPFPAQVVVRAVDEHNNPAAGVPLVWNCALNGATDPSGTFVSTGNGTFNNVTDANGVAISDVIRANVHAGTWLGIVQVVAQPTVAAYYSLTNTPVAANLLSITQGGGQSAALNTAYGTLAATVYDGGTNPLPGTAVQFSVPAGHGTFAGGTTTATAVTNSLGVATAPTFTANAVLGPFTVTVSVPSAPTVASQATTWTTVDPAVATTVQATSGGGQQAAVSALFTKALKVKVTNALGNPVAGVSVTFTSPATGASCTFPALVTRATISATTDVNGNASSTVPQANALAGSYFVTATATGATPAQFQLTNGSSYQPEVCTLSAAVQGAVNQGSGTAQWVNPGLAVDGGTTGASVTVATAGSAAQLFCSPAAAGALDPIDDDAQITKIVFTYDVKTNIGVGASFVPTISCRLYDGTNGRASTITDAGGTGGNTWNSKTQTISVFQSPTTITGAQMKAGNFGMGFFVTAGSGKGGTGGIRRVKMSVCYQNPATPPTAIAVPLQFCEA